MPPRLIYSGPTACIHTFSQSCFFTTSTAGKKELAMGIDLLPVHMERQVGTEPIGCLTPPTPDNNGHDSGWGSTVTSGLHGLTCLVLSGLHLLQFIAVSPNATYPAERPHVTQSSFTRSREIQHQKGSVSERQMIDSNSMFSLHSNSGAVYLCLGRIPCRLAAPDG